MKPIEQHLTGYLLSLQRGSWTKAYNRQCLDLWGKKYGEQVAAKVERLVKDKWHESPSSYATTQDLADRFTKDELDPQSRP